MESGTDPSERPGLRAGELRRQRKLGSEAVYRVLEPGGELVLVEVVSGPGLTPGDTFRFTAEAVREMDSDPYLAASATEPPDAAVGPGR